MTAPRSTLRTGLLQAAVAGLTTWLTMLSWRGFSLAWMAYLGPLLVGAGLIAVLGAVLRWFRVQGLLLVAAQIVVAFAYGSLVIAGSPVPWGKAGDRLANAVSDAVDTAQTYASPVPLSVPGIEPLLIPLGLAFLLLVDVLACSLRRVPLAGLVLLVAYSIPVGLLAGGVSWFGFALSAAGFMGMLFLHEEDEVSRWGRPLEDGQGLDSAAFGVRTGAVRRTALGVGGVATALAVVLPVLIPTLHLAWFGSGPGGGSGNVSVINPITDLRHDLRQRADAPLLRIVTDDPQPEYLRLAVLTSFSNNEWRAGDRDIPTDQAAHGQPLPLPGVNPDLPRDTHAYDISIYRDFESRWLPTMPQTTRVDAAGDWRYDARTMDFLAADDATTTPGLSYSVSAARLDYSLASLTSAGAPSSTLQATYTQLPTDLPAEIERITREVTTDQPSKYLKAVALQDFFRKDGGFRYDQDVKAGNGASTLVAFLDPANGRAGYCEQFASAMAVMAREAGIPARVAVGFYRPELLSEPASPGVPATYEYSTHDLHAWPELYFPGSGWVVFEPTPSTHIRQVPGYTRVDLAAVTDGPATDVPSSRSTDDLQSRGPSVSADAADRGAQSGTQRDRAGTSAVWWAAGLLSVAALTALVVALPRLIRRRRRERRWATLAPAEAAWSELRDTMRDLALPWPEGRSPRTTALHIASYFGAPTDQDTPARPRRGPEMAPGAVAALDRIVHEVELLRYAAPSAAREVSLQPEVASCVEALVGGTPTAQRRRARWFPRSVTTMRKQEPTAAPDLEVMNAGNVVDHVG